MNSGSNKLFAIIESLRQAHIFHRLHIHRDNYVCVEACVPGEIWEIDVRDDGDVEVEVFRSTGEMLGESELAKLIEKFND